MKSLLFVLVLGTVAFAGSEDDRHLLDSYFPGELQYTNPRFTPPPSVPNLPPTPPVEMTPIAPIKIKPIAPIKIKPIAPMKPMKPITIRPMRKMKPMEPMAPVTIRPMEKMKPMKPMKPISPMRHGKGIKPPPGLGPEPGEERPLPRKMQAPQMRPKLPGVGHETSRLNGWAGFGDVGRGGAFRGF
ncbi:hypothetical protein MMC30_007415 [Trapelia coarctata]|nr:hypothetical protein [Trapelia coarctata]